MTKVIGKITVCGSVSWKKLRRLISSLSDPLKMKAAKNFCLYYEIKLTIPRQFKILK